VHQATTFSALVVGEGAAEAAADEAGAAEAAAEDAGAADEDGAAADEAGAAADVLLDAVVELPHPTRTSPVTQRADVDTSRRVRFTGSQYVAHVSAR